MLPSLELCGPILKATWADLEAYVGRSWGLCWPMLTHVAPKDPKNWKAKNIVKWRTFWWPAASGGLSWGYVGPFWSYVGISWGQCGPILGLCWPILELCWPILGLWCPILERCWPILGLCWYVGPSWGYGAPSWSDVGPSWGYVGPSWGLRCPLLRLCWPILRPMSAHVDPSWATRSGNSKKHHKARLFLVSAVRSPSLLRRRETRQGHGQLRAPRAPGA